MTYIDTNKMLYGILIVYIKKLKFIRKSTFFFVYEYVGIFLLESVLMRSANLLNDFAFKYVFGEDCKEANDALKSLLTVFLERKVNHVVVKNSEMVNMS